MDYQNNNFNNNQGFTNNTNSSNNVDFDTELEKVWMGNLYNKAHSKKFSWWAAIFGPAYFFYKKMYSSGVILSIVLSLALTIFVVLVYGILGSILSGILDKFADSSIFGFISLIPIILFFPITRILCGFSFYRLYREFVTQKISELKQSTNNNSQLLDEAFNGGSPSFPSVILFFLHTFYVGLWFFMVIVFLQPGLY